MRRFNFRDVGHRCGIPSTNKNNWEIGQILVAYFARMGIGPERLLTDKTDPNPSVQAPHCIAHYPGIHFDGACAEVTDHWRERAKQGNLF